MEWSKLKNIIILILALVNLFLLVLVVVQKQGSAQYQEQALIDALNVLERNGIRMEQETVPAEQELLSMTVQREQEEEAVLAAAVLGECSKTDLGSGRHVYESAIGTAEFRSNGNFSVSFLNGLKTEKEAGGEETHALEIMAKMGISAAVTDQSVTDGQVKVVLCQMWQGVSIYSCQITMVYQNGSLLSVAGQRLMGEPQQESTSRERISVPTALLRVLNGINDLGDICSEITEMVPGYLLNYAADEMRMTPVWYVTTDTGTYYLNAVSGELTRI